MKSIQYFDILKRAFVTTWNNKFLWVFGLVVILGSIGPNINVNNTEKWPDIAANFASDYPNLSEGLIVVFGIIMFILFFMRFVAIAAIIKSANNIKLYRQLGFKKIFLEVKKYFWKLLLLEILVSLLLVAVFVVLAVPIAYLFELKAEILAALLLAVAFAIILPLSILTVYLRKYAYYFVVLSNAEIKVALESAYLIFEKNLASSLLMGLITIGIGAGLLLTILVLLVILALVFTPFALVAFWLFAKTGAIIVAVIAALLTILLFLGILSWYEAFLQTAWLYFFQQIAFERSKKEEVAEKLKVEGEIPTPEAV